MTIKTQHPDYIKFNPRWELMTDTLDDEDVIKEAAGTYLPKTEGMILNDASESRYEAFKDKARYPQIASQAMSGIVGLVFEKDPAGESDEIITNTGQSNRALSRDVIRGVTGKGRDVLIVDAPSEGGEAYIARHTAESLINWKTEKENPSELTLAVFEENVRKVGTDKYSHETEKQYRVYEKSDTGVIVLSKIKIVEGKEEFVEPPITIPLPTIPVIAVGSIDLTPKCDPIPLLPVSRCALAYYRKSALYEQALHLIASPTPWVKNVNDSRYRELCKLGLGSNAFLHLGNDGEMGLLEVMGQGLTHLERALDNELEQAETYAVRLTQRTESVESAAAIAMRSATQHASIYSVADAASLGITKAQELRALWNGTTTPEPYELRADFDQDYAGEQMIKVINEAVNSFNAPLSVFFEALRKSGLTDKTDEELTAEIASREIDTPARESVDDED